MQVNLTVSRVAGPIGRILAGILISVLVPTAIAFGQDKPVSPFTKIAYGYLQGMLLRSADKVPEEHFSFQPTEEVRSFGQILGHVADSQYMFCSMVLGDKNPALKIEKTKSSKADLTAALKESFAYCDKAYESITPASAAEMVKFHGQDMTKLDVLTVNNMHTLEHYGNLVTYMRLKHIVPPSSEPQEQPAGKK